MDANTFAALTALATKLGTTTEYLWGSLLRQAPFTGIVDLAFLAALVLVWGVSFRFIQRKTSIPPNETKDNQYRYLRADWEDEGAGLAWAFLFIFGTVKVILIGSNLSMIFAAFLNPEYWALKQIIK